MPKNRSIIILTISLAVLLCTVCGPVNYSPNPPAPEPIQKIAYLLLLPDNYVGWVRVDFGVPKAELWRLERYTITATIPESGVTQTQSELYRRAEVLLYYQGPGKLVPVPNEMYTHYVIGEFGIVKRLKDGLWMDPKGSWYFFVGPPSLKARPSFIVPPKSHFTVHTPGRMTIPPPETQPSGAPN